MLPLVCDYLRHHSLQELEDEHGVVARHNKTCDKFSLNYDQILVKSGDKLADQCRGLVVRPAIRLTNDEFKTRIVGDVEVVAWPMNRFYNFGDSSASNISWNDESLKVYEKLDGTMIVSYWDPLHERWHAGTRSVPEADIPIKAGHMEIGDATFSDLFFLALKQTNKSITNPLDVFDKDLTYVFELTSQYNRVVVKYDEPSVTLIAARHTANGKEVQVEEVSIGVPIPRSWPLNSPSAIDAFVNSVNPAELEGAVVCDSNFQRIKIKNKSWVMSSKAKDMVTVSRRSAIEAIIAGTVDDVLPLVEEEIADELRAMQTTLRSYIMSIDENFKSWKDESCGSRKRFAELVNLSNDWVTPYFQLYDGKGTSALEWITSQQSAGKLTPRMLDTILQKINT